MVRHCIGFDPYTIVMHLEIFSMFFMVIKGRYVEVSSHGKMYSCMLSRIVSKYTDTRRCMYKVHRGMKFVKDKRDSLVNVQRK